MFLLPLSYTLSIHFYTCSLDLCTNRKTQVVLLQYRAHAHALCKLTFRGLLGCESDYKAKSKVRWWVWLPRRISIVLPSIYLRECHHCFLRQHRVNPHRGGEREELLHSRGGWGVQAVLIGRPLPLAKKTHQNLGTQCLQLHQSSHMFLFYLSGPHSSLIKALILTIDAFNN